MGEYEKTYCWHIWLSVWIWPKVLLRVTLWVTMEEVHLVRVWLILRHMLRVRIGVNLHRLQTTVGSMSVFVCGTVARNLGERALVGRSASWSALRAVSWCEIGNFLGRILDDAARRVIWLFWPTCFGRHDCKAAKMMLCALAR